MTDPTIILSSMDDVCNQYLLKLLQAFPISQRSHGHVKQFLAEQDVVLKQKQQHLEKELESLNDKLSDAKQHYQNTQRRSLILLSDDSDKENQHDNTRQLVKEKLNQSFTKVKQFEVDIKRKEQEFTEISRELTIHSDVYNYVISQDDLTKDLLALSLPNQLQDNPSARA